MNTLRDTLQMISDHRGCRLYGFRFRRGLGWFASSTVPGWEHTPVSIGKNSAEAIETIKNWGKR